MWGKGVEIMHKEIKGHLTLYGGENKINEINEMLEMRGIGDYKWFGFLFLEISNTSESELHALSRELKEVDFKFRLIIEESITRMIEVIE